MARKNNRAHILLGVTGSIAIYKACDIVTNLARSHYRVTVAMTKEAQALMRPLTFQALSANPVVTDMFRAAGGALPHISLADSIDLLLIAPATANIIGKLASGICDDILTATVVSTKAKVLMAPAMNGNMYKNPVIQENISRLKGLGYRFIGPVKGHLACGYDGIGHIAPVEEIVKEAKRLLK